MKKPRGKCPEKMIGQDSGSPTGTETRAANSRCDPQAGVSQGDDVYSKRVVATIATGLITLGAFAGLASAKGGGAAVEPVGAPKHVGEVIAPGGVVTPPAPAVHQGGKPKP